MCVESCSLIIFTSALFIGLYYSNVRDGFLIPLLHVYAISPSVQIFDISFAEIGGVTDPQYLSNSKRSEIRNNFEYFADSYPRY